MRQRLKEGHKHQEESSMWIDVVSWRVTENPRCALLCNYGLLDKQQGLPQEKCTRRCDDSLGRIIILRNIKTPLSSMFGKMRGRLCTGRLFFMRNEAI